HCEQLVCEWIRRLRAARSELNPCLEGYCGVERLRVLDRARKLGRPPGIAGRGLGVSPGKRDRASYKPADRVHVVRRPGFGGVDEPDRLCERLVPPALDVEGEGGFLFR